MNKSRKWFLWSLLVFMVAFPQFLKGHEGHGTPGSVPPPPHGGKLKEAEGGKSELFFEATYKAGVVKIYPLYISDSGVFESVSPSQLSEILFKLENPRTKKVESAQAIVSKDALETKFDSKGASRFLVHLSANYKGEKKRVSIQIEKK